MFFLLLIVVAVDAERESFAQFSTEARGAINTADMTSMTTSIVFVAVVSSTSSFDDSQSHVFDAATRTPAFLPSPTYRRSSPIVVSSTPLRPTAVRPSANTSPFIVIATSTSLAVTTSLSNTPLPTSVPSTTMSPRSSDYVICNGLESGVGACVCFGCAQRKDLDCCIGLLGNAEYAGVSIGFVNLTRYAYERDVEMSFRSAVAEATTMYCLSRNATTCNFSRTDVVVFLLEERDAYDGLFVNVAVNNSQSVDTGSWRKRRDANSNYLSSDVLVQALLSGKDRLSSATGYLVSTVHRYSHNRSVVIASTEPPSSDSDRNLIIVIATCVSFGAIAGIGIIVYSCYQCVTKMKHYDVKNASERERQNVELKPLRAPEEKSTIDGLTSQPHSSQHLLPFVPSEEDEDEPTVVASSNGHTHTIMSPAVRIDRTPSPRGAGIRRLPSIPVKEDLNRAGTRRPTQKQRISQILGRSKVSAVDDDELAAPPRRSRVAYADEIVSSNDGHPSTLLTQTLPSPKPILAPFKSRRLATVQTPELLRKPARRLPDLPPVRGSSTIPI